MSFSESPTPEADHPAPGIDSLNWTSLASVTATEIRVEFEEWLDGELQAMESALSEFSSHASQFKGRR
ncbi:MAG: hypothetical protein AAF802_13615 [Planctomycetota bacterium]